MCVALIIGRIDEDLLTFYIYLFGLFNGFDFNGGENLNSIELIDEFGIVFLMFTIGLELSFSKLKKMKEILFFNGLVQVL
jgi:Kef-type K+ transport system membrane component KefB